MAEEEDLPEMDMPETETATLAPQLGSSLGHLARGEIDMRILGVLMPPSDIPKYMRSLVYLLTYADLFNDEAVRSMVTNFLHLTVAVGGRGRRDIIRMESVARGGQVNVAEEIQKPGWLARNLWNRDWERKEREKLGLE